MLFAVLGSKDASRSKGHQQPVYDPYSKSSGHMRAAGGVSGLSGSNDGCEIACSNTTAAALAAARAACPYHVNVSQADGRGSCPLALRASWKED